MVIGTSSQKAQRHEAVLAIVRERRVRTQAELQRLLRARGHRVDQATLSRDVRELGLVKSADGYAASSAPTADPVAQMARSVRTAQWSGNLVVVKTDPGSANLVGVAIDRLGWPEVVGTVAGDDTLLVVVREGARAKRIAERFLELRPS